MTAAPRVTVLGSMNMDISVTVPRLPGPGATVLGSAARFTPGGKGGNQAVAAARLGARVRMVGCVGDDVFGAQLAGALRAESVDTSAVRLIPERASGLALITVDPDGENMITVASGANQAVGDVEVSAALAAPGGVLVVSAEIPVPAIAAALARAAADRVTVPAQPGPGPGCCGAPGVRGRGLACAERAGGGRGAGASGGWPGGRTARDHGAGPGGGAARGCHGRRARRRLRRPGRRRRGARLPRPRRGQRRGR